MSKAGASLAGIARLALDTMVFIYAFENHPKWGPPVQALLGRIEDGELEAVTSSISVVECLTRPYSEDRPDLAALYEDLFLSFPHLRTVSLDVAVARRAARLRADHALTTPDALQVAAALESRCEALVTHDLGIPEVEGMRLLRMEDLAAS